MRSSDIHNSMQFLNTTIIFPQTGKRWEHCECPGEIKWALNATR